VENSVLAWEPELEAIARERSPGCTEKICLSARPSNTTTTLHALARSAKFSTSLFVDSHSASFGHLYCLFARTNGKKMSSQWNKYLAYNFVNLTRSR